MSQPSITDVKKELAKQVMRLFTMNQIVVSTHMEDPTCLRITIPRSESEIDPNSGRPVRGQKRVFEPVAHIGIPISIAVEGFVWYDGESEIKTSQQMRDTLRMALQSDDYHDIWGLNHGLLYNSNWQRADGVFSPVTGGHRRHFLWCIEKDGVMWELPPNIYSIHVPNVWKQNGNSVPEDSMNVTEFNRGRMAEKIELGSYNASGFPGFGTISRVIPLGRGVSNATGISCLTVVYEVKQSLQGVMDYVRACDLDHGSRGKGKPHYILKEAGQGYNLYVPQNEVGCWIGKQGRVIKELEQYANARIHITGRNPIV